jgi:hypothetical protein
LDNSWSGGGSIENGWGTDIKAKNVSLSAATSIGALPAEGDSVATMRGKALDIANIDSYDSSNLPLHSVTIGGSLTGGVNVMTPVTGTIRYTNVLSSGDIRLDTAREIVVDGSIRSTLGSLSLYGANEYGVLVNIANTGSLRAKNDLSISVIDEAQFIGKEVTYTADMGNIVLAAGREVNLRNSTLTAGGGINLLASNGRSVSALVDAQGTMTAGTTLDVRAQNEGYIVATGTFNSIGDLTIAAGRSIDLSGSLNSATGSVSVISSNSNTSVNTALALNANITAANDAIFSVSGSQASMVMNTAASARTIEAGRNIGITSAYDLILGGTLNAVTGITIAANDDVTIPASLTSGTGNLSIQTVSGDINLGSATKVGSASATQGLASLQTGTGNIYIGHAGKASTITANNSRLITGAGDIKIIGNVSSNLDMELRTDLGNIEVGAIGQVGVVNGGAGTILLKALGTYDSTQSELNQIGNITIAPGSSIAISTGELELNAASILKLSSITSSSNSLDAIKLRGFDVIHNSDTNADVRMNSNGWISLRAHRYIDINNIDYRGTSALYIEMTGVANSGNSAASAVAVGINTSASVELNKLYAGYAAVSASNVPNFNVVDARITRTSFFNINNTIGRVGDIDVVGIDYAAWTGQNSGTSAFSLATAVASGTRNWDFNVSGTQASEGLAVLGFNLGLNYSGSKPVLETNAVVVNYRPLSYVYAGLSQDEIRAQEELAAAQRAQAALEAAAEQARLAAIARAEALAAERLAALLEADRLARLRALADAQRLARQFVPPPPPPVFVALPIIRPVLNITANVISFSSSPTQGMRSVTIQPASPSANTAPASSATSSSSNAEAGASSSSNAASGTSTTSTMESNSGSTTSAGSSSSTGTSASGNRDGEGGEGGATNQTTPNAAPTGATNEIVQ